MMETDSQNLDVIILTGSLSKIILKIVGTYKLNNPSVLKAMAIGALQMGVSLIDTAAVYKKEDSIAEAVEGFLSTSEKKKRSDIYISTKIIPIDQGYEHTTKAVDIHLKKLRQDYVDLMLVHWPGDPSLTPDNPMNREIRKTKLSFFPFIFVIFFNILYRKWKLESLNRATKIGQDQINRGQ